MRDKLLHSYDWLQAHKPWLWGVLSVILLSLIVIAATLRYNEDIMDFLPATDEERAAFERMQSQQSAVQLVLVIEGDSLRDEALEVCAERIEDLQTDIDIQEQLENLYAHLPSLIPDSVYDRFDSLFTPEAIRVALLRDKTILATPGASMLSYAIQADPLGLVPIANYQSPITNKSYAFYESPYGATETKRNAALVDSLTTVTGEVAQQFPNLHLRWTGAPVIAVGNARRIKTDTVLCISLSLVLIVLLLAYAFPRRRDLWLILLAVSFGWLTGMAVLRLVTPAVSAIVLGIGSVLIGIAVNYPLHLLVHQRYTTSVRQTLDEVLTPLVVGNITTVGAFMALIPLQATAMRHLGIFASAMLVGTILFCVFVLPHLMSAEPTPIRELKLFNHQSPISNHQLGIVILGITILFGLYLWLVPGERFDANMSHINYMTPEQRADMETITNHHSPITNDKWSAYWSTHDPETVIQIIRTEAQAAGFRPEAFEPFYAQITNYQSPMTNDQSPLVNDLAFRLSEDFDYIGICCSIIVFVFLWLSFRSIWLALIAFIPMALSWVWILAIMQFFGLQFNIVNIILATFIFGQGDDYTIFIVEGLIYEHRTGKPMLPQYKQSIFLSALIMLIGIGILVLAVHPAMHSLGVITLIGMTIVLLMAVTIPPLLFRLLLKFKNP